MISKGSVDNLQSLEENFEASELPTGIRGLNGLVKSVVNSILRPLEIEFPEDTLIQTFSEFKNFLTQQVVKILHPELPPEPKGIGENESEDRPNQAEEAVSFSEMENIIPKPGTKDFNPVVI